LANQVCVYVLRAPGHLRRLEANYPDAYYQNAFSIKFDIPSASERWYTVPRKFAALQL